MSRAQEVLDRIVREAEADGFGAHGAHVLVGEDTALHHWSPGAPRRALGRQGRVRAREHEASPSYARYSLGAWGGPGDAWRLHGAYGQLVVLRADAVVTMTADDHLGADRMAERVVAALAELTS